MKLNFKRKYAFRKEKYVLVGLLGCMFLCSVGYAILSQQLKISGVSSITTNFDVYIESIKEKSVSNAETVGTPSVMNKTSGKIEVNLNDKGSKAIYDVTVRNAGNVDALITAIEGIEEANEREPVDITVSTSGIQLYTPLLQGNAITFQIIVEWDSSIQTSSLSINKTISFSVEYQQKTTDSPTPPVVYPKQLAVTLTSYSSYVIGSKNQLVTTYQTAGTSGIIVGRVDDATFEAGHQYQVKVEVHIGEFLTNMGGPLALQTGEGISYNNFTALPGDWVRDGNIYTFDFSVSENSILASNIDTFSLGSSGAYFQWDVSDTGTLTIATISVYQTA